MSLITEKYDYNHETKDTEKLAIANFFFWKKNIKVWTGIAMMIIYFNITLPYNVSGLIMQARTCRPPETVPRRRHVSKKCQPFCDLCFIFCGIWTRPPGDKRLCLSLRGNSLQSRSRYQKHTPEKPHDTPQNYGPTAVACSSECFTL